MATTNQAYPRPDFERPVLRWQSLNGLWSFLFDDDDIGLSNHWQIDGIPNEVVLSAPGTTFGAGAGSSESDSITQRIAAGTQELIKDNFLPKTGEAVRSNAKREIQVPFVFQSPASGINERGVHEVLWYERQVADPRTPDEAAKGQRVILRFGAVDYDAKVWINGGYVGGHRGGHVPWELDVTEAMDSSTGSAHRLTLRVYDSAYDLAQPRGKQYWGARPESIFYTPSGGIWQNVWLEVVPEARIGDSAKGTVIRSNDIRSGAITGTVAVEGRRAGQHCGVVVKASFAGVPVSESSVVNLPKDKNTIDFDLNVRLSAKQLAQLPVETTNSAPLNDDSCWLDGVALWSPDHPSLYDLSISLVEATTILDTVATTTGMRSLDWTRGDGKFYLNKKPLFQALCLDQGYWPETFMTPPSADSLRVDIELAKRMGLNGCRKHQKVEDPAFYYWADKLGYLVWAEMANSYQFSAEYVDRFNQEWVESMKMVINRPCVVTWTPVNESWGYTSLNDNVEQRNHIRSLYYITKTLDDTRSINDNCGWEHVLTDLTTFHDYSDGPELEATCASLSAILGPKAGRDLFMPAIPGKDPGAKHLEGAPIMCTEFGGVNIAPAKKGEGEDRDWGYTTATDPEDLLARIEKLVKGVTKGGYCCAFVYTQLSDIEQEANGLYSFDRKEKLDSTRVRKLIEEAVQLYYQNLK